MSKEEFIMDLKYGIDPYLLEEIREAGEIKIFTQIKNNDKVLHGISIEREDDQPPRLFILTSFMKSIRLAFPWSMCLRNLRKFLKQHGKRVRI